MAASHRQRADPVTAQPPHGAPERAHEGHGFLALMRDIERRGKDKPRIGRNRRLREALVRLGQDPFLAFPDSELSRLADKKGKPRVQAHFLGFFGPYGALPLNTTEEVLRWFDQGDEAFVEFTDIFAARFIELFYRAWADARPITQFDHPDDDRFQSYLLTLTGTGTPAYRCRDSVSDTVRLRLAGLAAGRVKSPVRLRQMLQVHFAGNIGVEIEELVPVWLDFEDDALSRVGQQNSSLGRDIHLGGRVRSIGEKITIHLHLADMDSYHRFLPGGADHAHLRDIVFWYLGRAFDIDVALWLPHPVVPPAILGRNTQLGWMACIAPVPQESAPGGMVCGTVYHLSPGGTRNATPMAA